MKHLSYEQKKILEKITVVLLTVFCIVSGWFFIYSLKKFYIAGELRSDYNLQRKTFIAPPADVADISTWMTFNYVNVVFKLPPTYLQGQLSITDPHYPNIRIDAYARRTHMNTKTLLTAVQNTISAYQTSTH